MQNRRNRDSDTAASRKRNLRLRFKKIVQAVLINQKWMDDVEEQGIVMNAKRNVAFVIRPKRKLGILTVSEKALLRTAHSARTLEERRRLCLIIASLPCFSQIPPKMRVRLIPYLTFATINEDHKLIRQDDVPIMVYFIISGEIEVQKTVYSKSTKKTMVISEAIVGPGDTIGDVELLENTIRYNTYVALTPCEVFLIMEHEYFDVLGKFMRTQWFQKKRVFKALSYFNFFTEDQLVRACQYGQLVQFDPLKSIYSEDAGAASYVYFLLSGECVILQCLQMMTQQLSGGAKNYKLVAVKTPNENIFERQSRSIRSFHSSQLAVADKKLTESFNVADLVASYTDVHDGDAVQIKKAKRKLTLRDIEVACKEGFVSRKMRSSNLNIDRRSIRRLSKKKSSQLFVNAKRSFFENESEYVEYEEYGQESEIIEISWTGESNENVEEDHLTDDDIPIEIPSDSTSSPSSHESRSTQTKVSLADISVSEGMYSSSSSPTLAHLSFNVPTWQGPETHFMDVGSLSFGAIFGLGERMTHRVIMARTVVQCLILPRYWLLEPEQNPGRIWLRYKYSLESSIPSREDVFNIFLKTRHWEKFKVNCVQRSLELSQGSATHPEDIPIIARIVETRDDI